MMISTADLLTSTLASGLRGWQGIRSRPCETRPAQPLQLYDIENCPYCRIVREVLTELDLDAEIYPCPKGGERFRPALVERGGKAQFPYLVDPNTGREMYESIDIVKYLYHEYGDGEVPLRWRLGGLQKLSSSLASAARLSRGMRALPSRQPEQPLELFSFEGSPFARPVRELLCQLEIPYLLRSCGRSRAGEWLPPSLRDRLELAPDSELANRLALQEREGRTGIPYLFDPNTARGLFESGDILDYLREQYA
jgi:glutathione S-transferase